MGESLDAEQLVEYAKRSVGAEHGPTAAEAARLNGKTVIERAALLARVVDDHPELAEPVPERLRVREG